MAVILIPLLLWLYVIFCLINGRKIEVPLDNGSNVALFISGAAISIILFVRNGGLYGLLSAVFVVLAFLLYMAIPSGYNQKGIYIRGRLFPLNRIKDMQKETISNKIRLSFEYRRRFYCLYCDSDDCLEKLQKYWGKKVNRL